MNHYPNQAINVGVLASLYEGRATDPTKPDKPDRGGLEICLVFYDFDPDNTNGLSFM